jgi:cystathionine gamma-lyase
MIDNTWATPLYQNPIEMGVDIVMHTASKYLGGHSDIVAGALISDEVRMNKIREEERAWLGNTIDPHTAWLMTRGMRTLPVRMEKHQQQGMAIAEYLENHPRVRQVFFPGLKSHPQQDLIHKQLKGFSGLLSFIPAGTDDQILAFVDSLKWFQTGCSWGGFESLVIPIGFGMDQETEERLGIPHGLVRISVGLENLNTLLEDLDQALAKLPLAKKR